MIVLRTRVARRVTLAKKMYRLGSAGADHRRRAGRAGGSEGQDFLSAGERARGRPRRRI